MTAVAKGNHPRQKKKLELRPHFSSLAELSERQKNKGIPWTLCPVDTLPGDREQGRRGKQSTKGGCSLQRT